MRKRKVRTIEERRCSERITDDSILCVRSVSHWGESFKEIAKIKDVSSDGISFFLNFRIAVDSVVELEICPGDGALATPVPLFQGKGVVLRVIEDKALPGRFLVATRFLESFRLLKDLRGSDDIAQELQQALESDEQARRTCTEGV